MVIPAQLHYNVLVFDEVRPKLKETSPQSGEKNAIPGKNLKFVFSEAIDRKSVSAETLLVTGPDGAVEGGYSFGYYRPDIVYFTPKKAFSRGVSYKLHVTDGITDRTGNKLEQEHQGQFTTDGTSPVLLAQYPSKDAQGVPSKPVIKFTFSEAVLRETLKPGAIRLLDASAKEVMTEMRYGEKDKVIELHPKTTLKLGTRYQLELSGTITDRAGNPLVSEGGSGFKSRTTSFTTGSILFSSPADSTSVRENSLIEIAISGEGLAISDVIYEVNGNEMTPVAGPKFAMSYRVPLLEQGEHLSILAIARDQERKEIARKHMLAPIDAGLHGYPALIGATPGAEVELRLALRQALDRPLDIRLSLGDESVASVADGNLRLPAGQTVAYARVRGLKSGRTWIAAESDYGNVYATVTVNETQPGEERLVNGPTTGLSIMPSATRAMHEGVVYGGTSVSRTMPEVSRMLTIPNTGKRTLHLPLPGPLPGSKLRLELGSAAGNVLSVDEVAEIASGSRMLPLKINAHAAGKTWVDVAGADRHYRIPLQIGPKEEAGHTGIQSAGTAVAVNTPGFAKHLHLSQLGKRSIDIPLLSHPAAAEIKVELVSSAPSVVDVVANSSIPAGSRSARVELKGLAPGSGVVSVKAGNVITPLFISVVDVRKDSNGAFSHVPSVSVAPAGSAGTLYMLPESQQTVVLRISGGDVKAARNVSIKSRHPEQVTAATSTARIEAGSRDLVLTLLSSKGAKGEALLDLQFGDRKETLKVIIVGAEKGRESPLLAPAVGIEIKQ